MLLRWLWYGLWLYLLVWLLLHLSLLRYGISQAYGFFQVWMAGRPIAEMQHQPRLQKRYVLLQKAFAFAAQHGLDTAGAFACYLPDENDKPLMVVSASSSDVITPYCWKFPVLGEVPYKGFYDRELMLSEIRKLKQKGMDVDTARVQAWSSLGWFSEIMTPSFYEKSDMDFTETLFHELTHRALYLKDAPDLNENLAQACGEYLNACFWGKDSLKSKSEPAFGRMMCRLVKQGNRMYAACKNSGELSKARIRFIKLCVDSVYQGNFFSSRVNKRIAHRLGTSLNAYLAGYTSYYSNKDSLKQVLEIPCRGNLKLFFQRVSSTEIKD